MSTEYDDLMDFIRTQAERRPSSPTVSDSTELIESQILDSVNLVRLILLIQEKWGLDIDFNDLDRDNFRDFKTIRETIERMKNR